MRTSAVPLRSVGTPTAPPPGPMLSARSMRSEVVQALPLAPRRASTPPPPQLSADGRRWLGGPVVRRQASRDTPRQVHVEAATTTVHQPVTRTQSSSTNLTGQAACRAAALATYGQLPVLEESHPCPTLASGGVQTSSCLAADAPARPLPSAPQWTTAVVARDLSERILRKTLPAVPVAVASGSTNACAGVDTPTTTEDSRAEVVLPETPVLDKSAVIVQDGVRCSALPSCLAAQENIAQPVGVTLLHDASTQTPPLALLLPSMMARLDIELPLAGLLGKADSWLAPVASRQQVAASGDDEHDADEDNQLAAHGATCRVHCVDLRVAPTQSEAAVCSEQVKQGSRALVLDAACATPVERPKEGADPVGVVQDHSLQLSPLTPSLFSGMSASHSTVSTLPSPLLKEGGGLMQLDLEQAAADELDALPTFRADAQGDSQADEQSNKHSPTRTPLLGALRKRAASLSQRLLRKERQCQALQEALNRCHRSIETAGQWEVLNASLRSTAEGPGAQPVPASIDTTSRVHVVANEVILNRALWPSSHTTEPEAAHRAPSPDKKMVPTPQKVLPRRPLAACENIF